MSSLWERKCETGSMKLTGAHKRKQNDDDSLKDGIRKFLKLVVV